MPVADVREPVEQADKPAAGTAEIAVDKVPIAVTYERQASAAVPRRWLFLIALLLFLNVVATTSISWGPTVVQSAKQALAERRAAAAQAQADAASAAAKAAALRQRQALHQQGAAYRVPAGQVVYTEDLTEADRLLKSVPHYSAVESTISVSPTPHMPHPPVYWGGPPDLHRITRLLAAGSPTRVGTVFLHGRRTGSGRSLLVWVYVKADRKVSTLESGYGYRVTVTRHLVTDLIEQAGTQAGRGRLWSHTLTVSQPPLHQFRVKLPGRNSAANADKGLVVQKGDVLRLLGGRADPRDARHFEIDYTLDGRPGTIDGWVTDDGRVRIEPRDGRKTVERFDAREGSETWDPHAAAPPTGPGRPPPRPKTGIDPGCGGHRGAWESALAIRHRGLEDSGRRVR